MIPSILTVWVHHLASQDLINRKGFPTMHRQQCRIGSVAVTLILALSVSAMAQTPLYEYGSIDELRGVKVIYIDTGTDLEVRQNMIKEIAKKLPGLQIASRPQDATIALMLSADSNTFLSGVQTAPVVGNSTLSTPQYRSVIYGSGILIMKGSGPDRIRILAEFKESRGTIFERRVSTNIARDFVKAYRKVNGKGR